MSTSEKGWRTVWLRGGGGGGGGSISEVSWIGRDVLGWCSGLHLVFLDVPTNRLRLVRLASSDTDAAGASCLSGHLRHRVFAVAEKNIKPRIYVFTYPSMTKISTCLMGTSYNYLATAFHGDYLVSLGSIYQFRLTIWLWRTGDKIISVSSPIHDAEGQILRTNYTTPMFIAEIGKTSGKLLTWETRVCGTASILNKNEIALPKKVMVKDVSWCYEDKDVLAIVDRDGHVYLCNSTGEELRRVILSQRCVLCTDIEPAAICWYKGGIVLRTTYCQLRYYLKDKDDNWRHVWIKKITDHPYILTSHPLKNERVFLVTTEGHIVQVIFSNELNEAASLNVKQFIGGKYQFIDFVRPWDNYIVAMDESMELAVIQVDVGVEVSKLRFEIKGKVIRMLSHPDYPLVVVTSDEGEVVFVSVIDYQNPKILGVYWMQEESLDLIKFSNSGRYVVTCTRNTGMCYFFDTSCKKRVNIITQLDVKSKITDVMLFDTPDGLRFCVLQGVPTAINLGYRLAIYHLPNNSTKFSNKIKGLCLFNFYGKFQYISNEPNAFVGTPHLSKKLTYFKTDDWNRLNLYYVAYTDHYVRQLEVSTHKKWLTTAGSGGMVAVTNLTSKKNKSVHVMTHHRRGLGVLKAIINSTGDLVIALGRDGSIVATNYYDSESEPVLNDKLSSLQEFGYLDFDDHENDLARYVDSLSKEVVESLTQSVISFTDTKPWDIPWIAWKKQMELEEETKIFAKIKEAITHEFNDLKSEVVALLDENETFTNIRKLPISAFALDKFFRDKKKKAAKDEREEVKREQESNIFKLDGVSGWIRNRFWEHQKVLARSIFGMFDNTEVTNYTISNKDVPDLDIMKFAHFTRNVCIELTSEDNIYPWEDYNPEDLKVEFLRRSRVKKSDIIEGLETKLFDEDEEEEQHNVEAEKKFIRNLYEGLTTHRFIEPFASYYSQFKIYAYSQFTCDNCNIREDTMKLRYYFNKHFDDMLFIKEREMILVRERVDRIFHISSELKLMFNEQVPSKVSYPNWHLKERPESIIEVADEEIKTRPYISPAEQEIFDKKAAEEEKARLARQADNFREQALQYMMDGVLEVRWEDIIKRDPEKPECLESGKLPENYTEEENLAVKRYEQELSHVISERQKYHKILQNDYARVNSILNESIDKFDSRLQNFHLMKIKLESAIQQLNLRYVRYIAKHVRRVNELKEIDVTKTKIKTHQHEISSVNEKIQLIKNAEQELHRQYENLLVKDKLMDKKMQTEFPGLKKNALTAILMQYKRRPRITLKNTSPDEGLDLGKSIATMTRLPYLTSESLDYIRQLDNLDVRPVQLPASIEKSHWDSLVALRRLKIAQELKLRAAGLAIETAENYLTDYGHKLTALGSSIGSLDEQMRQARKDRIQQDLNLELQLVLKMGQIEDEPLRGVLEEDLAAAILVPQRDLERVNEAILAVGKRKVRAVERGLRFGRTLQLERWEETRLKTLLQQQTTEIYYTRTTNVTREMREYLKRKLSGKTDDKTTMRIRKDYEKKRANLEKMVKEWQTKLIEISEELERTEKKNRKLDKKIEKLNVERCERELKMDFKALARQKELKNMVVKVFAEKSAILRKLVENYEEIKKMRDQFENSICGRATNEYVEYRN